MLRERFANALALLAGAALAMVGLPGLMHEPAGDAEPGLPAPAASSGAALGFLLFTRQSRDEALAQPSRRALFEHIQRNPGTAFRETARAVGIAAGTVRHHLNVLMRADVIVERPHGPSLRFFTREEADVDWVAIVMLREPALKVLHDWLALHPVSPQKAILEAMEARGWSRSTTQHRLVRLVDAGLVAIRLQGRYKIYSLAERPKPIRPAMASI